MVFIVIFTTKIGPIYYMRGDAAAAVVADDDYDRHLRLLNADHDLRFCVLSLLRSMSSVHRNDCSSDHNGIYHRGPWHSRQGQLLLKVSTSLVGEQKEPKKTQ